MKLDKRSKSTGTMTKSTHSSRASSPSFNDPLSNKNIIANKQKKELQIKKRKSSDGKKKDVDSNKEEKIEDIAVEKAENSVRDSDSDYNSDEDEDDDEDDRSEVDFDLVGHVGNAVVEVLTDLGLPQNDENEDESQTNGDMYDNIICIFKLFIILRCLEYR